MRALALASLIVALAPGSVHAGPFCDLFQGATAEKQGAYVLFLVDEILKNFPQHDRVKLISSYSERLAMFADTRKKIASECATGEDFAAGIALGEDLAIYKMGLLKIIPVQ